MNIWNELYNRKHIKFLGLSILVYGINVYISIQMYQNRFEESINVVSSLMAALVLSSIFLGYQSIKHYIRKPDSLNLAVMAIASVIPTGLVFSIYMIFKFMIEARINAPL